MARSSVSSSSPPSHSHSPRNNLPRGKACMNCRRRKIKCDGHRPVCNQCRRSSGTSVDCEYPLEGRSRTQQLEETIKTLQTRIGELEMAANDTRIFLHPPQDNLDTSYMPLEMSPSFLDPPTWSDWSPHRSTSRTSAFSPSEPFSPSHIIPAASSHLNSPTSNSTSSSPIFEEPPPDITDSLVDAFLTNFTQAGFFLDRNTFFQSALLALPFGDVSRPTPALLYAVYTWGARLAAPSLPHMYAYNEDAFLMCTLQNIHQDLASTHPQRILHTIQAEILLSMYYLTLGRPLEGVYHSSAAASLAVSAGLHLIRSSDSHLTADPQLQNLASVSGGALDTTPLPAPSTVLEREERINAFWTVVLVNNYWVAVHGSPSALPYADTPIETPWPRELSDGDVDVEHYYNSDVVSGSPLYYQNHGGTSTLNYYHQPTFDAGGNSGGGTVARFLSGLPSVDGFSALALLAKASILLERAVTYSSRYSDPSNAQAFGSLDALLARFILGLPGGLGLGGADMHTDAVKRSLVITFSLAHAAVIRLHARRIQTSDASRTKSLAAAHAIVHIINATDFSQARYVDPIMGLVWTTACDVFVSELSSLQSYGVVGRLTQQHVDLTARIDTVLDMMRVFAGTSPLIQYYAARVAQAQHALALRGTS